ncbi:hypothetical protein BGX33_009163 [Mortierella sp. NVP41]|nr:hypothetical protein BGX33_009163 [Mortierella sp. NVP41]
MVNRNHRRRNNHRRNNNNSFHQPNINSNQNNNQFDNQNYDNDQYDTQFDNYNNNGYDNTYNGNNNMNSNNQFNNSNNQFNNNNNNTQSTNHGNVNKHNKRGRGAMSPDFEAGSRANPQAADAKRRKNTAAKGPTQNHIPPPSSSSSASTHPGSACGSQSTQTTSTLKNILCQHELCIELARQDHRSHADARCFRFTNPKRFQSILRKHGWDQKENEGLAGEQLSLFPVMSKNANVPLTCNPIPVQKNNNNSRNGVVVANGEASSSHDEDLKIRDYLYMKDKKQKQKQLSGTHDGVDNNNNGSPYHITWRYSDTFEEGEEETANGLAFNNNNGLTEAPKTSRNARRRARVAARKAQVEANIVGGSSLNDSTQSHPPQKQWAAASEAQPARTRVMDARGQWGWDDDTDEWDRPLNILEARALLADMDRLGRPASPVESPPSRPFGGSMGEIHCGRYMFEISKRPVAVHSGMPPTPSVQQKKKPFAGGFRGIKPGDNRIALPVEINGVVLTGLLASGRITSCIDTQVAEALGLRVWADPGLEIIDHYRTHNTKHTCNPVTVDCNDHTASAVLDVDDLHYYDFQIGADLTRAFGMFIGFK